MARGSLRIEASLTLQRLMQHKSYLTTQRYINMAHQVKQAADKLHVPDVLKKAMG